MTLRQFLSILKSRWLVALGTFVTIVALVMAASMLIPKRYSAVSQVLVDVKSPDPVGGLLLPPQLLPGYMATQVDIVGSRGVAERVVDRLGLHERPEFVASWQDETGGAGNVREFIAQVLLKRLDVRPVKESSVLNLTYGGSTPRQAAEIANAFADAYIARTVEMRTQPAQQSRAFFGEQADASRRALETAQTRLTHHQRETGITSTDERLDIESSRLQDLSAQLTVLQNQLSDATRRRDLARAGATGRNIAQVPEIVQNPVIQSLKSDLAKAEARQSDRAAVLGPNHPESQRLQAELDAIRSRIAEESQTIVGSVDRSAEALRQREADLQGAIGRQRQRVLQIRQQRDELATLQRELESAQRNFDQVTGRLNQTNLESKSTMATVMLLTSAVEPLKPSRPNLMLNGALAAFVGLGAGCWAAVGAELRRRRIRSVDDLMQSVDLPILARIRRLPDPERTPSIDGMFKGLSQALPGVGPMRPALALDGGSAGALGLQRTGMLEPAATQAPAGDAALDTIASQRRKLGEILVDAALMTPEGVVQAMRLAAEHNLLFGEAAVRGGLVSLLQVKQALAFQFDYPVFLAGETQVSREVIAAHETRSIVADFRKLRTQVMARWQKAAESGGRNRILAIVSPSKGDGKTVVAANLAVTFSQAGLRTLLIDGDLRSGRIHRLFGLPNRVGLTGILNGGDVDAAIQHVGGLRNLALLCAGLEAPNPSDLLSREVLEVLLDQLAQVYDVVIVDTPNAAEDPDAELLARCTDGVVIVGRSDRTAFDDIASLTEQITAMGVPVVGSAFVDA